MTTHRDTIEAYWQRAEARDWAGFGALLADDIVYEMPQTRERIRGRDTYLRFNRDYPGDWHLVVEEILVDGDRAVSRITMTMAGAPQQATSYFSFDGAGHVSHVTDFWPEPYDPPAGRAHLVERY